MPGRHIGDKTIVGELEVSKVAYLGVMTGAELAAESTDEGALGYNTDINRFVVDHGNGFETLSPDLPDDTGVITITTVTLDWNKHWRITSAIADGNTISLSPTVFETVGAVMEVYNATDFSLTVVTLGADSLASSPSTVCPPGTSFIARYVDTSLIELRGTGPLLEGGLEILQVLKDWTTSGVVGELASTSPVSAQRGVLLLDNSPTTQATISYTGELPTDSDKVVKIKVGRDSTSVSASCIDCGDLSLLSINQVTGLATPHAKGAGVAPTLLKTEITENFLTYWAVFPTDSNYTEWTITAAYGSNGVPTSASNFRLGGLTIYELDLDASTPSVFGGVVQDFTSPQNDEAISVKGLYDNNGPIHLGKQDTGTFNMNAAPSTFHSYIRTLASVVTVTNPAPHGFTAPYRTVMTFTGRDNSDNAAAGILHAVFSKDNQPSVVLYREYQSGSWEDWENGLPGTFEASFISISRDGTAQAANVGDALVGNSSERIGTGFANVLDKITATEDMPWAEVSFDGMSVSNANMTVGVELRINGTAVSTKGGVAGDNAAASVNMSWSGPVTSADEFEVVLTDESVPAATYGFFSLQAKRLA